MTPKEKADDLVAKFRNAIYEDMYATDLALIHVNELLNMLWMFSDSINGQSTYNEYQQVKEELEKISK